MNKEEFKKYICDTIDTMNEQECQELSLQLAGSSKEQDIASELIRINGEFKKLTKLIHVITQNEKQNQHDIQNAKPYIMMYKFINSSQDILREIPNPNYFNLLKFNTQFGSFKTAYQTIEQIFRDILDLVSLTPLAEINQKFDQELHEIVETVDDNKYDDEIILEIIEQGFSYKNEIINYAKVKVNKRKD